MHHVVAVTHKYRIFKPGVTSEEKLQVAEDFAELAVRMKEPVPCDMCGGYRKVHFSMDGSGNAPESEEIEDCPKCGPKNRAERRARARKRKGSCSIRVSVGGSYIPGLSSLDYLRAYGRR